MTFSVISGAGPVPGPVVTNSEGNWSQAGFPAGSTYRVRASLSGYRFKPASLDFSETATDLDFKRKK